MTARPCPAGRSRARLAVARVRAAMAAFAADCQGSLSVEAVLALPLLCWFYVGSFVWFDAYRAQTTNARAAYTIADMISRESGVDTGYLAGLVNVFDFMTVKGGPPTVRISSVRCRGNCDDPSGRQLDVCWSWVNREGRAGLGSGDLAGLDGRIPMMPLGDTLILTETALSYEPAFNVGLPTLDLEQFVVTRPRFAPEVENGSESCY